MTPATFPVTHRPSGLFTWATSKRERENRRRRRRRREGGGRRRRRTEEEYEWRNEKEAEKEKKPNERSQRKEKKVKGIGRGRKKRSQIKMKGRKGGECRFRLLRLPPGSFLLFFSWGIFHSIQKSIAFNLTRFVLSENLKHRAQIQS